MLARDQLGQVAPALRGCAVQLDLVDAEVGVRAVAEPDRGRGPAHLLHGDAMLQIAEPAAAFLLLHGDTQKPEVAEPRPEVARELVANVDLLRPRRNLRLREALDRRADHVRRLAQPEIQAGHPVGGHCVIFSRLHTRSCHASARRAVTIAQSQDGGGGGQSASGLLLASDLLTLRTHSCAFAG